MPQPQLATLHVLLARLHSFLTITSVPTIGYLRFPPAYLGFPLSFSCASCGYNILRVPLIPERHRQKLFISSDFPGRYDIGLDPTAGKEGVMRLDVLATLFAALQCLLADTEWAPLETIDVQVLSKHAIVA